jgi:hypothetical protein
MRSWRLGAGRRGRRRTILLPLVVDVLEKMDLISDMSVGKKKDMT